MRRAPSELFALILLFQGGCGDDDGSAADTDGTSTTAASTSSVGTTAVGSTSVSSEGTSSTQSSGVDPDSGTSGSSSGASTWTTTTSTGGAPDLDCATYCDMMAQHCERDMIHPVEACEAICEHPLVDLFEDGTLEDQAENTLGCRLHHVLLAAEADGEAKVAACEAANLSGGGVCGSYCENYCVASMNACSDANPMFTLPQGNYPSTMACMAACEGMGEDVLDGIAQPHQLFGYGDTVQCRLHHLHAAMEQDNYDLHCPHASSDSTMDTCHAMARPNAANYCAFALGHCAGDDALFEAGTEVGDCMSTLQTLTMNGTYVEGPHETFAAESGNTLGCLNYWVVQTPWDPPTNCAAADWDPANWASAGGAGACHP